MRAPRRALAAAAFAASAAAIAALDPLAGIDAKLLDAQFAWLRARAHPAPEARIAIVGIDEAATRELAEPIALWHPHLSAFLEGLREAKPAVVALDLILPDRSYDAFVPGLDRMLARALVGTRGAFPTVLGVTLDEGRRPRAIQPLFVAAAGTTPAFAVLPVDGDGVVRRFDEALGQGGERVPTLVGEVARHLGAAPREGLVDFALGPDFEYTPFTRVLAAARDGDRAFLAERFGGRAVLLGTVQPYVDTLRVPVRLASWQEGEGVHGVVAHAQALRSLLAGRVIGTAPAAATVALAAGATLLVLPALPAVAAAIAAVALVAGLLAASTWALAGGTHLPVAWVAVAGLLALGARQAVALYRRLDERRRLRASFSGYVSPAVMAEIVSGRIQPDTAGVQMNICVLFSDIRNYTTMSEGMSAPQVLAFLNRYFDRMVEIVHARGGTVVSFMGDGIMAVFGAPQPLANACEAGFLAARDMLAGVEALNAEAAREGGRQFAIGVGLHAGDAVVGHVGSRTRHDFTAIGDVTNVASRLESATKEAGYRLVLSAEVAARLPDRSGLVPLGPVSIKGHAPVESCGYSRVGP